MIVCLTGKQEKKLNPYAIQKNLFDKGLYLKALTPITLILLAKPLVITQETG